MALLRCPVGFSEEMIAAFQMKKSQINTENDKHPKNFPFYKVFRNFSSDFGNWNVLKGQQGKGWLSSSLL